ncbi:unnamed protein product [Bursaphelenchus xylophilus]|uniref:(pine wood nematode) hypothetical protein n=1 Tax=Bursaphelenchus xylophilus TaxID=6326 RepID=A0A1I7RUZ8_BURXY|nr:unnamed protein product [Bursaphelenchus xylophilus]CAG9105260.1 unnamed protein product [Bursaphelenchus xylophilus]
MLLILASLPSVFALFSPQLEEVPKAFWQLYKHCDLQRYVPETATGAKIWSLEFVRNNETGLYAVEYGVDFENGSVETVSKQQLPKSFEAQGIWSHDMRKVGLITFKKDDMHFVWSDDPTRTIKLDSLNYGELYGFVRKDFVYAVLQVRGQPKFVRWKADLNGSIEVLGEAGEIAGFLQFIEPNGPVYYLSETECLEFGELLTMRLEKNSFSLCDTDEGMFNPSKLDTVYSMTIFAYLTRNCSNQTYSNYWSHAYAKIQFISRPIATTTVATAAATTTIPTS